MRSGYAHLFGRFDRKLKQALTNRHVLWIDAGEGDKPAICTQLIRSLEDRLPNLKLVVSVNTDRGMQELERRLPPRISRIYHPIDRRPFVSRALHTIRPEAIILLQVDVRPEFFWRARSMRVPLFLVGADCSSEKLRRYGRFGVFYRRFFSWFKGVGVQTASDAAKLVQLGTREELIQTLGVFQPQPAALHDRRLLNVSVLLEQLGVDSEVPIILSVGTTVDDEGALASGVLAARERFPGLFLVVVPEKIERSREVASGLEERGLRCVYRNEVTGQTQFGRGDIDCLVVNTPGELDPYCERASFLLVGGNLSGQSYDPLEAASFGKPLVIGPRSGSSKELTAALVAGGAAVRCTEEAGSLARVFTQLLSDPDQLHAMGQSAARIFRERFGATDRVVEMLIPHLRSEEVYVAPR